VHGAGNPILDTVNVKAAQLPSMDELPLEIVKMHGAKDEVSHAPPPRK
jgi:hypothetical protein